jgi:acetyl esterase/lipase
MPDCPERYTSFGTARARAKSGRADLAYSLNPRLFTGRGWWPRRVGQWVVTVLACALGMITVALAGYFLYPSDVTSLPRDLGARALSFSLHLLVVTIVALGLGFLAMRLRARLVAGFLALLALLSLFLALWPSIAMWQLALQENVPLSLGMYLAHAAHRDISGPQLERTVVYGTAAGGAKLVLDVWLSDATTTSSSAPAIVKVHGGGWTGGSRSQAAGWNRWLNQLSYHVFDVEYRVPPPERWKDEVGDIKCALGWIAVNAPKYGIDSTRISVMGNSAGGNLAMLAAYSMGDPRLPPSCDVPTVPVKSVVNLYGPADLTLFYGSAGSPTDVQNTLRQYIGGSPTQYPDRYRAVSPASYIGTRTPLPPTITFLGTNDHIVPTDQARRLDQALMRAGVEHETYLLPGNDHGFEVNWSGFGAQFARYKIKAFLQKRG